MARRRRSGIQAGKWLGTLVLGLRVQKRVRGGSEPRSISGAEKRLVGLECGGGRLGWRDR